MNASSRIFESRHCVTIQSVASSVFGGKGQGGSGSSEGDDGNKCKGAANHGVTRGR